jgi:hypothetical protein
MRPADPPRLHEVALDLRVFGFAAAAALIAGPLADVAPALQAERAPLASALADVGRTATAATGRLRQRRQG